MSLTPKQLAQYAKVCQRYGITELTIDGNYIKLEPYTPASSVAAPAHPLTSSSDLPLTPDAPTDEQLLYWSSGGSIPQD